MRQTATRLLTATLLFGSMLPAYAKDKSSAADHWVATWGTSPIAADNAGRFGAADMTLREIVHVSLGGAMVRVKISNEFGTDPLRVGEVHATLAGKGGSVELMSANALTFGGKTSITIPAGGAVVSDPAALKLPAFADLAVSIYIPAQTIHTVSIHNFANQTSYTAEGNAVGKASLDSPKEITSWPFLKGVDVLAASDSGAVICFGDSITDGSASTRNANSRWPDLLAKRLAGNKATRQLAVVNEGIGGNRVLHDGTGPNALARFDRDVLSQSGARYVVFLEGINDIGRTAKPNNPSDPVTAEEIIQGLGQLVERAHARGLKVIGATLTPYGGANYASPEGEAMREAVNQWIRTSKELDGFLDFDKAAQDPAKPTVFSSAADSGDHLHPTDAGFRAMVDAINLKMFTGQSTSKLDLHLGD